jgi:Alcohol dehydrogenase GroES-like domain
MATHRAVHVDAAHGPLHLVDVETTPPPPHHVRIAVHACGICGTDREFVHGAFPGMTSPLTPGHELRCPQWRPSPGPGAPPRRSVGRLRRHGRRTCPLPNGPHHVNTISAQRN